MFEQHAYQLLKFNLIYSTKYSKIIWVGKINESYSTFMSNVIKILYFYVNIKFQKF